MTLVVAPIPTGWRQLALEERIEPGDWALSNPYWLRCRYTGQTPAYYRGQPIIRRVDPAAPANPNEVRQ